MTWYPSAQAHLDKAHKHDAAASTHEAEARRWYAKAQTLTGDAEAHARALCAQHEAYQSACEQHALRHQEFALAWFRQAEVLGASGPSTPDERAAAGAIADGWIATGSCAADLARVARQAVNEVRLAILEDWCERVAGEGSPEERRQRVMEAIREAAEGSR